MSDRVTFKRRVVASSAVVAGSLAVASVASAAPPIDTAPLREAVTVAGITEHQAALEAIANANLFEGIPTRATGTPGHEASVAYVVSKMRAAGYNVSLQPFEADIFFEQAPAVFAQVAPNPTTYPRYDGQDGVWYTADFSGDGDVTRAAVAVDFVEPTAQASTSSSGCETSDFGPEVVDRIVLLQRGSCDFGLKVENAQAAGAVGAVIFNEGTIGAPDRNGIIIPTLAGYDAQIPVIGTDYATGRSLVDLSRTATGVTLRVKVDGFVNEDVVTNNVIAETPGGRADRTVVVGGHLDSVYEGPGINDDGSGVSMMLETAEQMAATGFTPRNKVRFIFFSGEEQGLLGSAHYVSQLSPRQVKDISVMLDFDMLASGNYGRFIYDGNGDEQGVAGPNGSGVVEQVFKDWYDSQGLAYETIPFDGRSDYDAFTGVGIPAGGIFAGAEQVKTPAQVALYGGTAGIAFDPCYHQLCDTLANLNLMGLAEHKDAAVHAIATFAQTTSAVNGTGKASSTATKSWDWKGDKLVR
ncbi:MAG: M20/M25/M40 family metallo-hydrolase [Jiangellaceae bacterium]